MPKKGLLLSAAAVIFLSFTQPASACDASCPLSHRKGHLAPWEQLVEKSFGIPAGFGKSLMTEDEWSEQKVLMAGMSTTGREEHKQKMNLLLMNRAQERGITIPAIGKTRTFKIEKTMPFDYSRR